MYPIRQTDSESWQAGLVNRESVDRIMKKYIQSEEGKQWLSEYIADINLPEHGLMIEITTGKRTLKQNSAIHVYFNLLAKTLNDAGLDQRKLLKQSIQIPWNADSVKEHLWKPIQEVVTQDKSTTKLDIKQVSEVYDVLSRHLAERHGILVDFPSAR